MSPRAARLLNFVLGAGFGGGTEAAAAGAAAAAAADSVGPADGAIAEAPEEARGAAASEATLGVAVAPVPPPASWETGLFLATAVSPVLGLSRDLRVVSAVGGWAGGGVG